MNQSQPTEPESRYVVRAAARVLDILDLLKNSPDGASISEIATAVDLPKSSVFRYLATLESRDYVEQAPDTGAYLLGLAFTLTHSRYRQILAARAKPYLEKLRDRFQETINLAILDGNRITYLEIVESQRAMRFAARPGDRDPIHSSALGKVIGSTLDEARVREILETEGMPKRTPHTITSVEELLAELEVIRKRGYALDNRENEEDGRCVAVPIPGAATSAALSLSAPAVRMSLDEVVEVAEALMETAEALAGDLGVAR
ncbi:MAG: IclR family transcriptional regulator [Acidimicrobiia bacterium]